MTCATRVSEWLSVLVLRVRGRLSGLNLGQCADGVKLMKLAKLAKLVDLVSPPHQCLVVPTAAGQPGTLMEVKVVVFFGRGIFMGINDRARRLLRPSKN